MTKIKSFNTYPVTSRLTALLLPDGCADPAVSIGDDGIFDEFQAGVKDALTEMFRFEKALWEIEQIPMEEAVPGDMLTLFSDRQWPELRFEFQPSLRFFELQFDTVRSHAQIAAGGPVALPARATSSTLLIFNDETEVRVRPIEELHRNAINHLKQGANFQSYRQFLSDRVRRKPGRRAVNSMGG